MRHNCLTCRYALPEDCGRPSACKGLDAWIATALRDGPCDPQATGCPGYRRARPDPLFARRLREERRAMGLTQAALAERLGVTVHRVSEIERGVVHGGAAYVAAAAWLAARPQGPIAVRDADGHEARGWTLYEARAALQRARQEAL